MDSCRSDSKSNEVYSVNPSYDEIEGDICYNALDDLPVKVDCVSVVVIFWLN